MNSLDAFLTAAHPAPLAQWLKQLAPMAIDKLQHSGHGDYPRWQAALQQLPALETTTSHYQAAAVSCAGPGRPTAVQIQSLRSALMQLSPWRKGPFELFGLPIDAEWRCDLKWQRLQPHLQPLAGKSVLDVGCGNGYYCLRMLGAGASRVIGLDPSLLFNLQFHAINHYCRQTQAMVLPLAGEVLADSPHPFDSVFSMGVLYHRRDPAHHLETLLGCLRPGGQLVLETLVIDTDYHGFRAGGRYANMRNVWFLPSVEELLRQLRSLGFSEPECVDLSYTTPAEQRPTDWMQFHSLAHALDPDDGSKTIEGHPAPCRAIVTAFKQ